VVGEAGNYAEVLEALETADPECVVTDYRMGDAVGVTGIERIRARRPDLPIILLTGVDSGLVLDAALRAGVDAVVLKEGDGEELLSALQAVRAGECFVSDAARSHMADVDDSSLTPREREVLSLLAQGMNNRKIGDKLFISAKTVDKHRSALLRKFDTHTTAELVAVAVRDGLIQ
jgi:DNA-binding NarL/FixJ family response regulator